MLLQYLTPNQIGTVLNKFMGYLDNLKTTEPTNSIEIIQPQQRTEIIRQFKAYFGPQFYKLKPEEKQAFLIKLVETTRIDEHLFAEFGILRGEEKVGLRKQLAREFLTNFPQFNIVVYESSPETLDFELLPNITPESQYEQLLTSLRFAEISEENETKLATVPAKKQTDQSLEVQIDQPENQEINQSPFGPINTGINNFTSTTPEANETTFVDQTLASNRINEQIINSKPPLPNSIIDNQEATTPEFKLISQSRLNESFSLPKKPKEKPNNTKTELIEDTKPDSEALAFNQTREGGAETAIKNQNLPKKKIAAKSSTQTQQKQPKNYLARFATAGIAASLSAAVGIPSFITLLNAAS